MVIIYNYTNIPTLITKIDNGDGTESNIPNNITHISARQYSTFIISSEQVQYHYQIYL